VVKDSRVAWERRPGFFVVRLVKRKRFNRGNASSLLQKKEVMVGIVWRQTVSIAGYNFGDAGIVESLRRGELFARSVASAQASALDLIVQDLLIWASRITFKKRRNFE
jgi:hypothetical protein